MVGQGRGRLGCLFALLVVAVVVYYGVPLVRTYWDYYKLKDEMRVTARFAQSLKDDDIIRRLRTVVDELDLPTEAKRIVIQRTQVPPNVTIRTRYRVVIELPFHQRTLTLNPTVEARQ